MEDHPGRQIVRSRVRWRNLVIPCAAVCQALPQNMQARPDHGMILPVRDSPHTMTDIVSRPDAHSYAYFVGDTTPPGKHTLWNHVIHTWHSTHANFTLTSQPPHPGVSRQPKYAASDSLGLATLRNQA